MSYNNNQNNNTPNRSLIDQVDLTNGNYSDGILKSREDPIIVKVAGLYETLLPYNNDIIKDVELNSSESAKNTSLPKSKSKDKMFILNGNNFDIGVKLIFETLAVKRGKRNQNMLKDGLTFNSLYEQLKQTLLIAKQIEEGTAGEDRKNFGTCKCTNPPSLGFCIEGLCVKANFNFSKLEGSLTITIPF